MKSFQDLNLCDDFLFKEVMRDEKLVIGFLEMVLNLKDKISGVTYVETEKTIRHRYLDKSIRLDVYVKDEENNVYNIEIQNGNLTNIAKRCRMYQSKLDSGALKPGEDYANLKKQYIIFVCTGDPFGHGLYKYTFENLCNENPSIRLGDESLKVFLNTKGHVGEVSRELKAFLNFVEKSTVQNAETVNDLYVAQLSAKIEDIKRDEALGGVFMTLEEKMNELAKQKMEEGKLEGFKEGKVIGIEQGIEQGIKEGIEQGIEQGIKQGVEQGIKENALRVARMMKKKDYALEEILELTGLTTEEIENL